MMKVVILDDYQGVIRTLDCYSMLEGLEVNILHHTEKNPSLLAEQIGQAEIIVLTRERTIINNTLLEKLPNLKLISQTGKISNHLDLIACTNHQVAVAEGVGSPTAPAELTWLLLMNALRQIPAAIAAMKMGLWQVNIGTSVAGKTIGIWGYGKIGKQIAQYAKVFGAKVLVWGSETSREQAVVDGFEKANSQEAFFMQSDVVTLHLRLNEKTFGVVKASDLSLMKTTAVLVNTARAELIEKEALIDCLQRGRPGFAALDVYEEEPIYDSNNLLLNLPNVICTPHLGYVERNGYELYFSKAFENVVNFVGGNPTNIVN